MQLHWELSLPSKRWKAVSVWMLCLVLFQKKPTNSALNQLEKNLVKESNKQLAI